MMPFLHWMNLLDQSQKIKSTLICPKSLRIGDKCRKNASYKLGISNGYDIWYKV